MSTNMGASTFFDRLREGVQEVLSHIWSEHKKSLFLLAAGAASVVIYKKRSDSARRRKWNSVGRDVVILHTLGRATVVSNISPYVVKLETYLRMAGLKYELDVEVPMGPKGKTPWITVNGEDVADSEICIAFLGKKYDKNFSGHLSSEQRAVAKMIQVMCDEHLVWGGCWERFMRNSTSTFLSIAKNLPPSLYISAVTGSLKKYVAHELFIQGMGRHSPSEIMEFVRLELEALSIHLGTKPFMMGEKPCEVDCCVFGHLSQFVWGIPGSQMETMIHKDFKNLVAYVERMKARFYPDWKQLLSI